MAQSIQELQRDGLLSMLRLGEPHHFKWLVHDTACGEIIDRLLKGAHKREGVTLKLNIQNSRSSSRLANVPVVYFVEPTEVNIQHICNDLKSGFCETCFINFASPIQKPLLTDLAKQLMHANACHKVSLVADRYMSYLSLSPAHVSLGKPAAYHALHGPCDSVELCVKRIVTSLVSMIVTFRTLPVIRCPASGPAEMVARSLDAQLRALRKVESTSTSDLFPKQTGGQRLLLCILGREMDLITMLKHTATYQAMAHDILGMRQNRVKLPAEVGVESNTPQASFYDFDTSDPFLSNNAGEIFDVVREEVTRQVEDLRDKHSQLLQAGDMHDPIDAVASRLNAVIKDAPGFLEKKRSLEMHSNVAAAINKEVESRDLVDYFHMEHRFCTQSLNTSVAQMEVLLTEKAKGTVADKTRALLVLYLTRPDLSSSDLQKLTENLCQIGGDASCIAYLQRLAMLEAAAVGGQQPDSVQPLGVSIMNRMLQKGEKIRESGLRYVKHLLQTSEQLPICSILEALMDQKEDALADSFAYFDPLQSSLSHAAVPRVRDVFRKAAACVIGGGNYVEMQAAQEWGKANGKHITYVATDMVSPAQFVEEITRLGSPSVSALHSQR